MGRVLVVNHSATEGNGCIIGIKTLNTYFSPSSEEIERNPTPGHIPFFVGPHLRFSINFYTCVYDPPLFPAMQFFLTHMALSPETQQFQKSTWQFQLSATGWLPTLQPLPDLTPPHMLQPCPDVSSVNHGSPVEPLSLQYQGQSNISQKTLLSRPLHFQCRLGSTVHFLQEPAGSET